MINFTQTLHQVYILFTTPCDHRLSEQMTEMAVREYIEISGFQNQDSCLRKIILQRWEKYSK